MDSEALLVRFLAGKDFERLSEVEPALLVVHEICRG